MEPDPRISNDPWEVLGVSRDASPESVRKAYRRQAKRCHPDKAGPEGKDTAAFIALREAYDKICSRPVEEEVKPAQDLKRARHKDQWESQAAAARAGRKAGRRDLSRRTRRGVFPEHTISSSSSDGGSSANEYAEGLGCPDRRSGQPCFPNAAGQKDDRFFFEFDDNPREEYFEEPATFKRHDRFTDPTHGQGLGPSAPGTMPVRSTAKGFSLRQALLELEQREGQEQARTSGMADSLRKKLEAVRRRDEFRRARRAAGAGPVTQCNKPSQPASASQKPPASPSKPLSVSRAKQMPGGASAIGSKPPSSGIHRSPTTPSKSGRSLRLLRRASSLSAASRSSSDINASHAGPSVDVARSEAAKDGGSYKKTSALRFASPKEALQVHRAMLASARTCFDDPLVQPPDEKTLLKILKAVAKIQVTTALLKATGIGVELNNKAWRESPIRSVATKSRQLVRMWREAHRAEKMNKRKAAVLLPVDPENDSGIEEIASDP